MPFVASWAFRILASVILNILLGISYDVTTGDWQSRKIKIKSMEGDFKSVARLSPYFRADEKPSAFFCLIYFIYVIIWLVLSAYNLLIKGHVGA